MAGDHGDHVDEEKEVEKAEEDKEDEGQQQEEEKEDAAIYPKKPARAAERTSSASGLLLEIASPGWAAAPIHSLCRGACPRRFSCR